MPKKSRIAQPNKKLARLIQELLELPTLQEATVILRTVLNTIKDMLLRGERVYMRGFGTFKIVKRTHRPTPGNILMNVRRSRPGAIRASGLLHYAPRKVIIFEPSMPLMAMLNMETPNYKERRSQLLWASSKESQ